MISENEIWNTIDKFCSINLKVFENLSFLFRSYFNLLIYSNTDKLIQ